MRITQRKGDIATTRAIASFTATGWDVSIPVTESAAYDLIVDTGSQLARVQCKYSSTKAVSLRRIHSNSRGYVVKRTAADAYDWLYVLRADGTEYLIRECFVGRNSVTPRAEHAFVAGVADVAELLDSVRPGAVAERTNALALKARDSKGSGGSNPSRSARATAPG